MRRDTGNFLALLVFAGTLYGSTHALAHHERGLTMQREAHDQILSSVGKSVGASSSQKASAVEDYIRKKPAHASFSSEKYRCCKVGEKAGLKRMPCDVRLTATRNLRESVSLRRPGSNSVNIVAHIMALPLGRQIQKCAALYSKYYLKCCNYRARFVQIMAKCKTLRSGKSRRRCRSKARWRYP